MYSPQYPPVKIKSDNSHSTSVSTMVPATLVPMNFAYLFSNLSICQSRFGIGSMAA